MSGTFPRLDRQGRVADDPTPGRRRGHHPEERAPERHLLARGRVELGDARRRTAPAARSPSSSPRGRRASRRRAPSRPTSPLTERIVPGIGAATAPSAAAAVASWRNCSGRRKTWARPRWPTVTACARALDEELVQAPSISRRSASGDGAAVGWTAKRRSPSSTTPAARSTRSTRRSPPLSSATSTGAGGPPTRQPSPAANGSWATAGGGRLRPRGRAAARGRARAPDRRRACGRASRCRSPRPRNASEATRSRTNPRFVVIPKIAVSSSAATSARRAASRVAPWAMTLPSIGSYQVPTSWPASSAASTRARGDQRTNVARPPGAGTRRPGPRRRSRASIAWPVSAHVLLRERQRLARGDPQLQRDEVEAA